MGVQPCWALVFYWRWSTRQGCPSSEQRRSGFREGGGGQLLGTPLHRGAHLLSCVFRYRSMRNWGLLLCVHSLRMYFLCWNCDCSSATWRCEGQRVSFRLQQKMCDVRASIGTPAASYLLTKPPYEQCGVKCLIAAFVCLGILHGGLHVPAASYSSLGIVSTSPYFATCRLCHR
jgi:hypothetical protein